jgi:hypothetical protein
VSFLSFFLAKNMAGKLIMIKGINWEMKGREKVQNK